MYLYLKTFKDGLYEGQELSEEFFIFEPHKGDKLTINKGDLDRKNEGSYPIEIEILDFDDKGIVFHQYDQHEKKYKEPVRVNIGETIEIETVYAFSTLYMNFSTTEYYVRLQTLDAFKDVSNYLPPSVYEDLFSKVPEYRDIILPKLLKEGDTYLLAKIYREGLLGFEKDELREFSYNVKERDYDKFLAWYNQEEIQKDFQRISGGKIPQQHIIDFICEYEYWVFRYKVDHHDNECIDYTERLLRFIMRDGYEGRDYLTYYLTVRDMSKFIVDYNEYQRFDDLELEYETNDDWLPFKVYHLYAIYLVANKNYLESGKPTYNELYVDLDEEVYSIRSNISWAAPRQYLDEEKVLNVVKNAAKDGDKYAIKVLEHYNIPLE